MGFDLHGRPLFVPLSLLDLVDWPPCPLELDLHQLGVVSVFHNVPLLNFSQFRLSNASDSVNEVWSVVWIVVVNEVWKHRNKVIFNGGVVDVLKAFALVQLKAWSWVTSKSQSANFSFSDWGIDPLVCMRMIS